MISSNKIKSILKSKFGIKRPILPLLIELVYNVRNSYENTDVYGSDEY